MQHHTVDPVRQRAADLVKAVNGLPHDFRHTVIAATGNQRVGLHSRLCLEAQTQAPCLGRQIGGGHGRVQNVALDVFDGNPTGVVRALSGNDVRQQIAHGALDFGTERRAVIGQAAALQDLVTQAPRPEFCAGPEATIGKTGQPRCCDRASMSMRMRR